MTTIETAAHYASAMKHHPRVAFNNPLIDHTPRSAHRSPPTVLAETIFWIAALVCAVAEIAILRLIITQRSAQNADAVHGGSPRTEIVWGIVPAIALAVLLVSTWHVIESRHNHMQMNHGGHEMMGVAIPPSAH